ncbi:histone H1.1, embryonic-like [Amyelois transitella]|uniref:histone H1.1, embryonic-like n=1 Tax=Amyelois transitella TaxID=680683 RepID=UPI00067AF844|nr:histone H1.1, embryonic-like [Amyelois transitella]
MSDDSDIDIQSALPKNSKKMPKQPTSPSEEHLNPDTKKISTKIMIYEALNELKSRKGTSLYAIKKFIVEKHQVDIDKINYIIKKVIVKGVNAGTIVQMKGVGASGSFKLAPEKKPEIKKPKPKKPEKTKKEPKDKDKRLNKTEQKKNKDKSEKVEKNKTKTVKLPATNTSKTKTKEPKEKAPKEKKDKSAIDKVKKMTKGKMTPAKKRAIMMKRKSIGSIIKPPKMKPRAQS